MLDLSQNWVVYGDNAEVLPRLPDGAFSLIYIDPPFNTGREQKRQALTARRVETEKETEKEPVEGLGGEGTQVRGFQGERYSISRGSITAYGDQFDDYLGFIVPRLQEAHRLLSQEGTLYFHIDYREAHYCKIALDEIFGREAFINEIIWAYDYGGRPKRRWPAKHDTILVYAKDPEGYFFDQDAVERIPYMAPGLVTPEKAERGKLPTDVWWHTIVGTNAAEKTGYATQKPEGILRRIVSASCRLGDTVLDFFAGSGTTGAVCQQLDRRFVLIDNNPQAIHTMAARLGAEDVNYIDGSATNIK